MSTITNSNYGYYQLSNPSGGQSGGANTNGTAQTNVTQSLVQALSGDTGSNSSHSNDAYLLSLSPAAQQYLNGGGAPTTGNSLSKSQSTFTLSAKQQQSITDILAKYKDAPYNQDTFNKIQNDLNAAGLGTTTLSLEDKNTSFNPSVVLINALNGGNTNSSNTGVPSDADEQTKSSNFIQNIISQWKGLSGGNKPAATATDTTSPNAIAPVGSSSGA